GRPVRDVPTVFERIDVAMEHARLQVAVQGEEIACRELRGLLGHYFRGVPGAVRIRGALASVKCLDDIREVLDSAAAWVRQIDAQEQELASVA
ncbi:MAG: hypothetical protein ACOVT5_15850, partial [Armatimonadaceae bacterium]